MNAQVDTFARQVLPPVIADCYPGNLRPSKRFHTREEFIAAARELVPLLKENASKANEQRRPVDEVVSAMGEAGLMGLLRPKMFGGAGLEISDMAAVAGVLAEGCPSTAWDYDVWEAHNWIIGMLPEAGQREVFGDGDFVLCCGVSNPSRAKARAVEGGYMLSGRWAFGSGSTHANWGSLGAIIEGRQVDGRPESRFMLVPRSAFVVLDTWNVKGLRGTGTHDIYIEEEVFIPEHRTLTRAQLVSGNTPGAALHDSASYKLPLLPAVHLVTGAPAIGTTKAMIQEFKNLTSKRVHITGQKQIEMAAPTIRLATALVEIEAAELLLQHTLKELESEVREGRTLSMEMRAKARMIAGYVPDLCKEIVSTLVSGSGVGVMTENNPLTNGLMDVTMMSLHQSTEYDRGSENYGRVVLGLPPSNPVI